jgi:hypothetical protein
MANNTTCLTCFASCYKTTIPSGTSDVIYKRTHSEWGINDEVQWWFLDEDIWNEVTDITDLTFLNALTDTSKVSCDAIGSGTAGCTQKSKSEAVIIYCDSVMGVTNNNNGIYTWTHNLNIINLNNIMFSPYPVVSSTTNSITFRTAECAGSFLISIIALGSEDCQGGTPPEPPVVSTRYMLSPVPYKFNIDLKSAYQKPTDAELEAYDSAMALLDEDFRAQRDEHIISMQSYVLQSHIKGVALPTSTVTCMPNNTGILSSKAKYIDLFVPEGVKTSYYGFPYDLVFKEQVAALADLPLVGTAGDIRYVIGEGNYYWHRSTNTWENDSVPLIETVNGITMDAEDFMTTNRGMRDAWLKALNEMLLATNILRYADDYLPSFQINKYKT